jgi:antitoxin MazE
VPTRLTKWGNSLGLRVPRNVAEAANLQVGDQMYVRLLDSGDILVRAVKPRGTAPGYAVTDDDRAQIPTKQKVEEEW